MSKIPLVVGGRVGSYILDEGGAGMDGWTVMLGIAIGVVLTLVAMYIFSRKHAKTAKALEEERHKAAELDLGLAYDMGRNDERMAWQQERDILSSRCYEAQVEIDRLRRQLNDESIFANALFTNGRATVSGKKKNLEVL